MAIDITCPFCQKAYRLRDDLAGKKVTCANQDCRKAFVVTPSANGAAKPGTKTHAKVPAKPAPPPPPPPPVDAEALAAAALSDEGEAKGPDDERMIEMTCTVCDHTWQVPWAMQGKNALCPGCKTRQKVPEQKQAKKADWRDRRQPSMAKVERLEGVVASQDNTFISGQTIREAGLVEVEYEKLPFSFYFLRFILPGLAVVILLGAFGFWMVRSRQERRADEPLADIPKAFDSPEMANLAPEVAPLYRAGLMIALGEYEARRNAQEHRDKAVRYFGDARAELDRAKRSAERDVLLGELAVAVLALGGTEDQVKDRAKLPWVPQAPRNARAQVKPSAAEAEGVQGQLRRAFESMRQERAPVEYELRASTARRVARELIRRDQVQMLLDTLQAGFAEAEQPEVRAQVGLELLRAGQKEKARELAEGLKATLTDEALKATSPTPASAQALWLAVEPPVTGAVTVASPPGGGEVTETSRLAYTALRLVQNKPDEALDVARKPGRSEGKLKALALAAEWAEQPAPFVEAAADILPAEVRKKADASLPSGQVLSRLGVAAARAGQPDKVAVFADPAAMIDEGLREWTRAEALRARLRANPTQEAKEEDAGDLPPDARKYRLGHAWARLQLARHNALRTADLGLARKYKIAWPTNTIAPFGQAGVALGVQDAQQ